MYVFLVLTDNFCAHIYTFVGLIVRAIDQPKVLDGVEFLSEMCILPSLWCSCSFKTRLSKSILGSAVNGNPSHTAFHYQPPIVFI